MSIFVKFKKELLPKQNYRKIRVCTIMKIPSLNNERHEIIIPSTGEKLLFKPFSISDIQELKYL